MMDPKQVVLAFVEAHNAHNIDAMIDLLSEDCVMIDVAAPIPLDSNQDVRKLYEMLFASVDIKFDVNDIISEGDKVFAALHTTGVGTGTWVGRDITGRKCDVFESLFCEVRDGQIVHCQGYSDTATLSKQLGGYSPAFDMEVVVKPVS